MDKITSTNVPGQQSQGDPTTNTPANVANPPSQGDQGTPTLEDLQKQLVDAQKKLTDFETEAFKRREKERERKQQEQLAEAQRLEDLRKKGEFEALTKTLQTTVDELKAQITQRDQEIAKRDHEALCAKVAAAHGLPPELAGRLTGSTEDELNADAKKLKQVISEQAPKGGNLPGPPKAGPLTPSQRANEIMKKQSVNYRNF